jgi:hypothetical protein
MATKDTVEMWLKRFVLAATAALLCALLLLVWRLSVLVQRLDQSVEALSSDVKNVAHMASEIAGVVADPGQLADKLVPIKTGAANPVAAREISYLMDCIGQPGLRYEYGDDNRSAQWVRAKFSAKYMALGGNIDSAEDFIRNVASETHHDEIYYVIQNNGEKIELSVFLTQALNKYRSSAPPAPPL